MPHFPKLKGVREREEPPSGPILLVYLQSGEKYFSVPVAGGEKTELRLPDSYEYGAYVFGMNDHVVFLNGDVDGLSYNVGSAKADGSDYVEYFTGED